MNISEAANTLQQESGVSLEAENIISFRKSILEGQWQLAETLLFKIPFLSMSSKGVDLPKVQFLIRQQKFLELLEKKETMTALYVLRSEITPLGQNTDKLHQLTSLVLCSSIEDVMKQAQWDGTTGNSRQQLLDQIQRKYDRYIILPSTHNIHTK